MTTDDRPSGMEELRRAVQPVMEVIRSRSYSGPSASYLVAWQADCERAAMRVVARARAEALREFGYCEVDVGCAYLIAHGHKGRDLPCRYCRALAAAEALIARLEAGDVRSV